MIKFKGVKYRYEPSEKIFDYFKNVLKQEGWPGDYDWYINGQLKAFPFDAPVCSSISPGQEINLVKKKVPPTFRPQFSQMTPFPDKSQSFSSNKKSEISLQSFPEGKAKNVNHQTVRKVFRRYQLPQSQEQLPCVVQEINGFEVELSDQGFEFKISKSDRCFQATLLEECATAKLSNFPIAKEEVETNEGKIMRFNGSKMLPLSNGNGFAIRWNTGKVSKFEVFFDEV